MRPGAPETVGDLGRRMTEFIEELQRVICSAVESEDGEVAFREDVWERPGGGGGRTRVLEGGAVFEKAAVNASTVWGELEEQFANVLCVDGCAHACSRRSHPRLNDT